jgi:sulfane dehydrogenase subunit SoxC
MSPRTPESTEPTAPEPHDGDARRFTRRSLFGASAGAAAAAVVSHPTLAQEGDNLPPSVPEWQLRPGEETLSQPYGRPSKFEANVVRRYRHGLPEPSTRLSSFSLTPLQDLCGIITPNGLHYERHHAGVPTIDPSEHRLIVHGLVERPLSKCPTATASSAPIRLQAPAPNRSDAETGCAIAPHLGAQS